jgi:hypothetical protein
MAIINVKEDWSELGADFGTEQASATRRFTVLFDTADSPKDRPMLAITANDGTTQIPPQWSIYSPSKPWLFVTNKRPKAIGPFLFEVMVYYSTIPFYGREQNYDPNLPPLDQPPQIQWTFSRYDAPIDRDLERYPITNSAKESAKQTWPFVNLVLHYTRNRSSYEPLQAASYMMDPGSVNSDYFLGFAPGVAHIVDFSGTWARAANLFYWVVNYEFHFRLGLWMPPPYNGYAKWNLVFGDEGFRYKNPTKEGKYENILLFDNISPGTAEYDALKKDKDSDGTRPTEPWPLNGYGYPLTSAQIEAGQRFDRVYEIFRPMPYSVLDIS